MFLIILRKVNLSLEWLEQWRRKWNVSIFWPRLQTGLSESRKPCFNLCSRRWLRPSLSLVSNLIPLGLWHLKILFPEGRINFKSFFLKINKFSELRIFWSSLFHSITTEGKNEFWEKLCFTLNWGILLAFLVFYGIMEVGIILNRYSGDWFLIILKKEHNFLYHFLFSRDSKPSLW